MIYVALLRGINVGGKNKIDMKILKKTFEKSGMKSVKTYINTGNIIFSETEHSSEELSTILENAIKEDFELDIKVLICNFDNFKTIWEAIPDTWASDKAMRSDVLFLWEDIDDSSIINQLTIKPKIDTVTYVSGAILWSNNKKETTKSGKMKLNNSKLYKKMTMRNVNTTRKIYELMEELNKHTN